MYAGRGTKYIHIGSEPDVITGAVTTPISLGTTFQQLSPGVPRGAESIGAYGKGYEYGRTNNPTRAAFERAMASAEVGGKEALAFASGLAATVALLHLCKQGDHVVCTADVYGGTQRYFRRIAAPTYGMTFSFVDTSAPGALAAELAKHPNTRMVWLETPTNPTLVVSDIAACAAAAKAAGALLVADNTFMSPHFQSPLSLGADVAMHSVTKCVPAALGRFPLHRPPLAGWTKSPRLPHPLSAGQNAPVYPTLSPTPAPPRPPPFFCVFYPTPGT